MNSPFFASGAAIANNKTAQQKSIDTETLQEESLSTVHLVPRDVSCLSFTVAHSHTYERAFGFDPSAL